MKLQEWVASYSGCDGGNPSTSSIWFVGIEWGWSKQDGQSDADRDKAIAEYHHGKMREAIDEGYCDGEADSFALVDHLDYTFGRNSAKLIAAIKGNAVENSREVAARTPSDEILKLNLYPIAFPDVDDHWWSKFKLEEVTGIATKQAYRAYCEEFRFPFLRAELGAHKPNLVLCTGSSYVAEFAKCFCGIDDVAELEQESFVDTSPKNDKARYLYWKWINEDTLFVTVPFVTNPAGLNSHRLLQLFGDRIRGIMAERELTLV